jgi:hypothetical protein
MLKKLLRCYHRLMCHHKWVDKTKPHETHYRIGCTKCEKEFRLSVMTPKFQREK